MLRMCTLRGCTELNIQHSKDVWDTRGVENTPQRSQQLCTSCAATQQGERECHTIRNVRQLREGLDETVT